MPAKLIRINLNITPEQKKALDRLTEQTGAPMTWLIQKAIHEYLERRKRELK
jgi:predicted transcriptional regulator